MEYLVGLRETPSPADGSFVVAAVLILLLLFADDVDCCCDVGC